MQAIAVENNRVKIEFDVPTYITHLLENENLKIKQLALLFYPYIQNGDISSGKVAEILGIYKSDLWDLYGEIGLPEELEQDIANLKKLRE